MENPCCSCKLTLPSGRPSRRPRAAQQHAAGPTRSAEDAREVHRQSRFEIRRAAAEDAQGDPSCYSESCYILAATLMLPHALCSSINVVAWIPWSVVGFVKPTRGAAGCENVTALMRPH